MQRERAAVHRAAGPGFVAALIMVVIVTACVGSVTKEDLDEEMRSRGSGGIGQQLARDAVDAVRDHLAVGDIELRWLDLSPGQATMEVRVPGTDDFDSYAYGTSGLYGGRGLDEPRPVSVSAEAPPAEMQVFAASNAGLARLDDMIDRAPEEASLSRGYVAGATIRRAEEPSGTPVITIRVTNERHEVAVSFSPNGSLLGTEQQ